MLLITRRSGEAIVINGTIEVKVLEVKSGRVKLGFEYPPGSSVFRQELFMKIQEENQAAALTKTADADRLANVLPEVVRNLHLTGKGPGAPAQATTETSKDAGNDHPTNGTGKPSNSQSKR
jgi:carbon storage regulator